ncbi:MAG: patatin-like phospholipase family protein [Pseudomonadota bacterium]
MRKTSLLKGLDRVFAALIAVLLLASCAGSGARLPVPSNLVNEASVVGFSHVRFWGDQKPTNINDIAKKKFEQTKAARPHRAKRGARPSVNYLAISGGGADGAFGAGLLVGWSASGKRPEFEIVTGISTGALIAPFAFLGKSHDPTLKKIYTTYTTRDFLRKQPLKGLVGGDSLASDVPFQRLIAQYVNEELMAEIAREHNRGRRLLIGTTNLDAQRPVIWDIGKIATSGNPQSLQLMRKIFLASASIPAMFPPVYINVTADGTNYQEMHVDGGTTTQVFLIPSQLMLASIDRRYGVKPRRRVYIIRNGRVSPENKPVRDRTLSIASRSISTLIKYQGIGDLYQLHTFARRNGMRYQLAYIPKDFKDTSQEVFDRAYMTQLFEMAYQQGLKGYRWKTEPPGL